MAHVKAGEAMLGKVAHSEVGKAMLIKIHIKIGHGPLGGDAIQSDGSLKITIVV